MRTDPGVGHFGNYHEAGFYASDNEFLELIVPFVLDGLAVEEPVILGYDDRKSTLLRRVLPVTSDVSFIADQSLYASPARAIEAYRREFERSLAAGARQVRIAGDVPHEGNGGRFSGWDRYESAVNVVWQDYPVRSRCLYDASSAPEDVRDVVERTHPVLVAVDGTAMPNPRYEEVSTFHPLPAPWDPVEAACPPRVVLIDPTPDQAGAVAAEAATAVVGPQALDELTSAVTEAARNARAHAPPPMTVKVWTDPNHVVVTVHDEGPGAQDPLIGLVPANRDLGHVGRGLWAMHQMEHVDVALTTGPGFTVRLRVGQLPSRVPVVPQPRDGSAPVSTAPPPPARVEPKVSAGGDELLRLLGDARVLRERLQPLLGALALVEETLADRIADNETGDARSAPERALHQALASASRLLLKLIRLG